IRRVSQPVSRERAAPHSAQSSHREARVFAQLLFNLNEDLRNPGPTDQSLTQRDAPTKKSPPAITVVPGREHMLNTANFGQSQPKTTAPAIRMTMAKNVLNSHR